MRKRNKRNINKVIKAISNEALLFNMGKHCIGFGYRPLNDAFNQFNIGYNICGTASCISGWSNFFRLTENGGKVESFDDLKDDFEAGKWLGLNPSSLVYLFYGVGAQIPLNKITKAHAVAVIKHWKETGIIDWRVEK